MKKLDPARFSHERWNRLLGTTFQELTKLATLKGGEYSGDDDRLANFRRNAYNLDLNKETVWAIYAAKHWDALMQFIQDKQADKERTRLEGISGRVDDLLVYLLLFKAMLLENEEWIGGEQKVAGTAAPDRQQELTEQFQRKYD